MLLPRVALKKVSCLAVDILGVNPFRVAVPASLLTIGPMLLLPSFKKLSYLNACGFLSTLVITLVVIVTLVVDPSREKMPTQVRKPS